MRNLRARIRRLEQQAEKDSTPTLQEYLGILPRVQARLRYSAKLKLYRIGGRDEDELWQKLSDHDREILKNDTEEQRARDEDVWRRSEGVHGPTTEETAARAARAKAKLKSMTKVLDR